MSINDPAIAQFFDADEAPWNYMMATAILYTLPPVASFFALRTHPRVSAAEAVRAAVLSNTALAIASEWIFAPELKTGAVRALP